MGWAEGVSLPEMLNHEGLTGQVKGNGNAMALSNPFWGLSDPEFGASSLVITSPKVHGVVVSIFTWYSFRQTLNRGRHIPSHSEFGPVMPLQHLPESSFPASLSNDISRNSKTPEDSAYWQFQRVFSWTTGRHVFWIIRGYCYFKNIKRSPKYNVSGC